MKYNPDNHHRRSIRLREYDYSRAGAYFVTLCAHHRHCLFGDIADGAMVINDFGRVVAEEWQRSGELRSEIEMCEFVVMPNHFHGIVMINDMCTVGARRAVPLPRRAPTVEQFGKPVAGSLPTIIRSFKSAVTKHINIIRDNPGLPVWQRNYYEHVIRNEDDYRRIAEYVADNPRRWLEDTLHPANFPSPP